MSFDQELAGKLRSTKCFSLTGHLLFSSDNEASADELEDEELLDGGDQPETEPIKTSKELDEEERKKRADELWADLMGSSASTKKNAKNSQTSSSTKPDSTANASISNQSSDQSSTISTSSAISAAPTKIKLTKEYEFAGERIRVEEEVDCNKLNGSKTEGDKSTTGVTAAKSGPAKRGLGINDLVANLGKKQKLSTLNKTKLDWDMFKQEEGIADDLKNHTKNKNSFVERQAFLQRTDLKQFELEKSIRDKNRTRNAG